MLKGERPVPADEAGVMLGLLQAVERNNGVTQRSLANELGVALGLINAYIKRGVKRGLIKIHQVPKRRFAYYLTPQGFAEKSRLAGLYLSSSFEFFRRARRDCDAATHAAAARGWHRIVLVGASDLAEVAIICAADSKAKIVGIVDARADRETFHGLPVWGRLEDARKRADAAMITSLDDARDAFVQATEVFGGERVLVPALLVSAVAHPVEVLDEGTA